MTSAPSATPHTAIASPVDGIRRTRRWLMTAGTVSLIAADVYVVDAFSTRDHTRMVLRLLMAALTLIAGVYLLAAPLDGAFTLTVILSMWFVGIDLCFTGAILITIARSLRWSPARGQLR